MDKQLLVLNKKRRAVRARMVRDAKKYAALSDAMLVKIERLSKEDLKAFLRQNPDMLLDIGAGIAAKVGAKARAVAANTLREVMKDWGVAKKKGLAKAGSTRAAVESKALAFLKKALSF